MRLLEDGWHFITPNGQLYKWDNSPQTALTGSLVATLDATYWGDLSLLYNAQRSVDSRVVITGQEVSDVNFANTFGHNGTGSGNVTATITNGNLQITGDNSANTVVIYTDQNGNTFVAGAGGTQVNGIRSPFAVTAIGNAVINLGGGDDQIVVLGPAADAAATLSVETGTGNDQVLISDAATNAAVTLSNSGGTDVRRIQSSQVGSLTLGGPGSSLIQGSTVNGGLTSSSNGITNLVVTGSTVAGATNVSGSALNDNVIVSRSIFGGAFTVAGNAGNDVVALINRSEFNAAVSIAGDAGNDTFGLRTLNAFRGTAASFDGGQGTDNVASDGASRTPTVRRTESNNNATLNNLIDLALSNFEDLMLDI